MKEFHSELFSKIITYSFSQDRDVKKINSNFSLANEQGFGGFCTDMSAYEYISMEKTNNTDFVLSMNIPFNNLSHDTVENDLVLTETKEDSFVDKYLISCDRHLLEMGLWDHMSHFIDSCCSFTSKQVIFYLHEKWIIQPEDFSRLVSFFDNSNANICVELTSQDEKSIQNINTNLSYCGANEKFLYFKDLKKHSMIFDLASMDFSSIFIPDYIGHKIFNEY